MIFFDFHLTGAYPRTASSVPIRRSGDRPGALRGRCRPAAGLPPRPRGPALLADADPRSARRPSCSSSRTTTSSACSIRKGCRWSRWACRARWRRGGDRPSQDLADLRRQLHLFRGTPTGLWLAHELKAVFGVQQKLTAPTRRRSTTRSRTTGDARVPPACALRAVQHRGPGHHRRRHRSAGAPPGHPPPRAGRPRPAHLPARRVVNL